MTGETKKRPFVIVSGLPGSGKTTVAHRVAARLDLPVLDKDDILERLFELKGTGDAAWRRALSRESDDLLHVQAIASKGAVLVSFWRVPGMSPNSGTPTGWLSGLSDRIVQLRCICSPALAATRFLQRQRHHGHLDSDSSYAQLLAGFEAQTRFGTVEIKPVITVDTSTEPNIDGVVEQIQAEFARCQNRLAAGGR
jgi:AAA domain-containing protein